MSRRHFGSVRKLPSGRYQASYWHQAVRHIAPQTFSTKGEAFAWLSTVESDVLKGAWVAPTAGNQTFGEFAAAWMASRRDLRPRTRELYQYLLDGLLLPAFQDVSLSDMTLARVRLWHNQLVIDHPSRAPKAYRLLKTILNAAVEDRRLAANPCQIKGASVERPDERPVASVAEVEALADAVPPQYKAMVLLAAWCSLRYGELAALTRQRVSPIHGVIDVQHTLTETDDGRLLLGPPKTKAGRRTLAVPPHVLPDLLRHIDTCVGAAPDALLFAAPEGGYLRRRNFTRRVWLPAKRTVGVPIHFHDLRHSGLTWSAATGATLAELMRRAGHASPRAALIYQHATEDRDRVLADALSELHERAKVIRLDRRLGDSGSRSTM